MPDPKNEKPDHTDVVTNYFQDKVVCPRCDGSGYVVVISGFAVRKCREEARVSLRQLAKVIGISAPYLSDLEIGEKPISEEMLARIEEALVKWVEALVEANQQQAKHGCWRAGKSEQAPSILRELVNRWKTNEALTKRPCIQLPRDRDEKPVPPISEAIRSGEIDLGEDPEA